MVGYVGPRDFQQEYLPDPIAIGLAWPIRCCTRVFWPSSFSLLLPCRGTGSRKPIRGGEIQTMKNIIFEPKVSHQAAPIADIGSLARAVEGECAGRYVAAWQKALKAIALRPFHPEAYIQMASTDVAAGDPEALKALGSLEEEYTSTLKRGPR